CTFAAADDRDYNRAHEATPCSYRARSDRGPAGVLHYPATPWVGAQYDRQSGSGRYCPIYSFTGRGEEPGRLASNRSIPVVPRAGRAGFPGETEIESARKKLGERGVE